MRIASYAAIVLLSLMQLNCVGSANYYEPPPGTIEYGSGPTPIDPDRLKVDEDKYPSYTVREDFMPPRPEACELGHCDDLPREGILKSDVWKVTHIFKGLYIIESKNYYDRECHYLAKKNIVGFGGGLVGCGGAYDFGIYITPDGVVAGGWALLPGSMKLFSERQTYLNPDPKNNMGWPSGIVFVAMQSSRA